MTKGSGEEQSKPATRVAICGGGASAVLLLDVLRRWTSHSLSITIIEPRATPGLGLAYSTTCPLHLLNTRASRMSIDEDPAGFLKWLQVRHPRAGENWMGDDFAPRHLYGKYLCERLNQAQGSSLLSVAFRRTHALAVSRSQAQDWEVTLEKGAPIQADVVVIATGNEAPATMGTHDGTRRLIIDDPWDTKAKEEIPSGAPLVLMGTGLTAVDVAIELLLIRKHAGPIIAFSRRGLLPRPHGRAVPAPSTYSATLPPNVRAITRRLRAYVGDDPGGLRWRGLFQEMQREATGLWQRLPVAERRRFLRHLRPFWEAHRHRLAPLVHERINIAMSRGQLEIGRGRLGNIETLAGGAGLRITLHNGNRARTIDAARLINCTGPQAHPLRSANPLLRSLVQTGLAQADALGLGLATDLCSRVIGAHGGSHDTLFALGPPARGQFWETTAIPEIRPQAAGVAALILKHARAPKLEDIAPHSPFPRHIRTFAGLW